MRQKKAVDSFVKFLLTSSDVGMEEPQLRISAEQLKNRLKAEIGVAEKKAAIQANERHIRASQTGFGYRMANIRAFLDRRDLRGRMERILEMSEGICVKCSHY